MPEYDIYILAAKIKILFSSHNENKVAFKNSFSCYRKIISNRDLNPSRSTLQYFQTALFFFLAGTHRFQCLFLVLFVYKVEFLVK